MSYKWLPFGEFEFTDDAIVFSGEIVDVTKTDQSSEKQARVGRTISDQKCYGGKISVDATFNYQVTNDPTSYPTTLEVAFFEAGSLEHMMVAGIGGNFALFAVREWDNRETLGAQTKGWKQALIQGGWVGQIKAGQSYNLSIQVEPSRITVYIDNIHVGSTIVNFPLINSYIGIFAQSPEQITLKNFRVEQYKPMVFLAMPFSDPYDDLYTHVFEPVCERCQLIAYRSEKTYQTGVIMAEIVQKIIRSHVANPPNPNVYYEVGFAHAMGKQVILVADRNCPNKLPFDVSPFRVLMYEDRIAGKETILKELVGYLRNILPQYEPITRYQEEITKPSRIL